MDIRRLVLAMVLGLMAGVVIAATPAVAATPDIVAIVPVTLTTIHPDVDTIAIFVRLWGKVGERENLEIAAGCACVPLNRRAGYAGEVRVPFDLSRVAGSGGNGDRYEDFSSDVAGLRHDLTRADVTQDMFDTYTVSVWLWNGSASRWSQLAEEPRYPWSRASSNSCFVSGSIGEKRPLGTSPANRQTDNARKMR